MSQEKIIGFWCDENICECRRAVSTRVRVVAHPKARGDIHPPAIAFWTDELAHRRELRVGRRLGSRRDMAACGSHGNYRGEQSDEHKSKELLHPRPPQETLTGAASEWETARLPYISSNAILCRSTI